ncbi:hypothetical protein [Streptomyces sp. NPDC058741]|uniref:hypothetical protein n=1 Tax=Streptomyces sp. NPDC058741 TaxID=3346620 RepID=UPI0036BD9D97
MRTPMEIAQLHRSLSHTLLNLQRAVERWAVADATDLYALAWAQVAQAPPSETRKQREELQAFKKVLNSASWLEEGHRRSAAGIRQNDPRRQTSAVPSSPRPAEKPARRRAPRRVVKPAEVTGANHSSSHAASSSSGNPAHTTEPPQLETGRLSEIATELRPLLDE